MIKCAAPDETPNKKTDHVSNFDNFVIEVVSE